jgi:hypothetical protein
MNLLDRRSDRTTARAFVDHCALSARPFLSTAAAFAAATAIIAPAGGSSRGRLATRLVYARPGRRMGLTCKSSLAYNDGIPVHFLRRRRRPP